MLNYECQHCKYKTKYKTHYERHCLSKKHINNCNIANNKIKQFKCSHCNYKTTRKDSLNRHMKKHSINYNDVTYESNLFKKFVKLQTDMVNKIAKKGKKIIEKDEKIIELLKEKNKNTTINNTTKNKNVYNYIVNNVKPSTNVYIELEKPFTKEEIDNIKNKSALEGSYAYIHNRFINKRDYDEKILVCSDISRNKFSYYNENNEWVIDMKLRNLSELIFNKICKIVNNPLEFDSNKHNYEQFLDETKKQILLYEELKNTLKTKPTKLLNKLSKDTYIDENYISKHKILVDKNS